MSTTVTRVPKELRSFIKEDGAEYLDKVYRFDGVTEFSERATFKRVIGKVTEITMGLNEEKQHTGIIFAVEELDGRVTRINSADYYSGLEVAKFDPETFYVIPLLNIGRKVQFVDKDYPMEHLHFVSVDMRMVDILNFITTEEYAKLTLSVSKGNWISFITKNEGSGYNEQVIKLNDIKLGMTADNTGVEIIEFVGQNYTGGDSGFMFRIGQEDNIAIIDYTGQYFTGYCASDGGFWVEDYYRHKQHSNSHGSVFAR